jgi:hypothetical protein
MLSILRYESKEGCKNVKKNEKLERCKLVSDMEDTFKDVNSYGNVKSLI